jgi:hypothetical protein
VKYLDHGSKERNLFRYAMRLFTSNLICVVGAVIVIYGHYLPTFTVESANKLLCYSFSGVESS